MAFQINKMQDKKVLITGGLGFIGSNLARKLVEIGAEVTIFEKNIEYMDNILDIKDKIKIISGNICDEKIVKEIIEDKDVIYHLAWQTDLKKSMENPQQDVIIDLVGILNILEECRKNNPNVKVVFSSTVTILGDSNKIPANEDEKENPLSIYEANKLAAEKYLLMYNKTYGLKTTILRLSNVFGERQKINNPNRGILNFMIGRALRGEEMTVYGDGGFIRDYCYIQNYIDAFILAAQKDETSGEFFVLGSGIGRKFIDVVNEIKKIVKEITGKDSKIVHIPFPEGENKVNKRNFIADYSKFKKATGWYPKVSFEEGVRNTINFYKNKI
jgi:nucleoside-diphosphate-sugar epimerase